MGDTLAYMQNDPDRDTERKVIEKTQDKYVHLQVQKKSL